MLERFKVPIFLYEPHGLPIKKLLRCIEEGFEGDGVQVRGVSSKMLEALSTLYFVVALG